MSTSAYIHPQSTVGKIIKCKAAVAWHANDLKIEEVEVAPPKAHEVRVKILFASVCHTDVYFMRRHDSKVVFPVILGHQGAGIVESVGENVTKFRTGNHVIVLCIAEWGEFCESPTINLCQNIGDTQIRGVMIDGTTRFTCNDKSVYHFGGCSTFSEYTVVADNSLCKIKKKVPLDKVCFLGCTIPVTYVTSEESEKVKADGTSVTSVLGMSCLGLAEGLGCQSAGAKKNIGVDKNPVTFDIAKKFGFTEFVNPKDHENAIKDVLFELTDEMPEYIIATTRNIENEKEARESVNQEVICDEMTFGGWKTRKNVAKCIKWYLNGKLTLDREGTYTRNLEDINEAFHLLKDRRKEGPQVVLKLN